MRARRFILVVAIAALGIALWQAHRVMARRDLVERTLPPLPAAVDPSLLAARLADADRSARRELRGTEGVAELSRLYHANGFYPEAIACYEALRQLAPREARWPYREAILLADLGRNDEALMLLQQTAALAPDYLPARIRRGDLLGKTNRTSEAVAEYRAVLARWPGNPYALLGLARDDMRRRDWPQARERLREAVARHPDFVGGLSLLVTVHEQLGEPAAANAAQQAIRRRQPSDIADPWLDELWPDCYDPYRLSVAAAIANGSGNAASAITLLERAITLSPENSALHRNLAQAFAGQGDHAKARDHLQRAVALSPTDSDSWILLVETLRKLGQPRAALQSLAEGLAHCPDSGGLHLEMAREHVAARRMPEAFASFQRAAALRPADATPLVELADARFMTGNAEMGLAALRQALARQPGNPLALTSLAFYHIVTGNEPAALSVWREIQRQPRTPPALLKRLRSAYTQQFQRQLP